MVLGFLDCLFKLARIKILGTGRFRPSADSVVLIPKTSSIKCPIQSLSLDTSFPITYHRGICLFFWCPLSALMARHAFHEYSSMNKMTTLDLLISILNMEEEYVSRKHVFFFNSPCFQLLKSEDVKLSFFELATIIINKIGNGFV